MSADDHLRPLLDWLADHGVPLRYTATVRNMLDMFDDDYFHRLSTGEQVMVRVIQALWNGSGGITLHEMNVHLDRPSRHLVATVLTELYAD